MQKQRHGLHPEDITLSNVGHDTRGRKEQLTSSEGKGEEGQITIAITLWNYKIVGVEL